MKFSVSVPDDLWEAARTVIAGDSPSGVVQEALRRVSSEQAGEPSYAEPPAMEGELAASLAATRERLLGEARGLYQAGYRKGVELASRLNWGQLSSIVGQGVVAAAKSIAQQRWDIHSGRVKLPSVAEPVAEAKLLAEFVGSYADFTDTVNWTPSPVTVEGMDHALREIWDQVRSPMPSGAKGSEDLGSVALEAKPGAEARVS